MTSNNVTSSTSHTSASSSVRPRAKRLISGLSDGEDNELSASENQGRISPFDSRSASPIPQAHPQRASTIFNADRFTGTSWGRRAQVAGAGQRNANASPTSPSLARLWGTSWSTLQGLASDFLGNEGDAPVKEGRKNPLPKWYTQRSSSSSTTVKQQWGPSAPTSALISTNPIGTGTKQERESAVRAQKRKDMLLHQNPSYGDALGKFKRRLSDDMDSRSAPPGEGDDRAALVYLHHVGKDDTLAGISIKYNCSVGVVRKANRMWANDTAQSRQTLVIPVDACGVKGRVVEGEELHSLLASSKDTNAVATDREDDMTPTAAKPPLMNGDLTQHTRTTSHSTSTETDTSEPPWTHDSWVLLPSTQDKKPTEIARLSRLTLGYFPPARRKSLSQSSTPSTSLDIPRDERNDSRSPQRPRRTRRLSNATTGYFPSYLAGPGGVGTMGKNVRTPGPAQDGLNKIFAKHLPDVAPPKNQTDLYHPEVPLYTDDDTSGVSTPVRRSGNDGGINLENVGGAIESWARRMVVKATTPSEAQARGKAARASVGTGGKGGGGVGDLIEMVDEFEVGGDDDEDEEESRFPERGRQTTSTARAGGIEADLIGGAGMSGREGVGAAAAYGGRKSGKGD